ncbi:unnamed protein product [Blepharisma stoltei]|uniref:Uncharacterized protein n=1 Tax=Blepharisma stoltei TaxID=1481888 RepID=A0AAU9K8M3_9CILI|nr:unnamed protein product [Blepharisma stoltei]
MKSSDASANIFPTNNHLIPSKVFLTEAKQEIDIPQGFDEHPEYEQMFNEQLKRSQLMKNIGIESIGNLPDKSDWKETYIKNRIELEKAKAFERQRIQDENFENRRKRQEEINLQREITTKRKYDQALRKINFKLNDPKYTQAPFYPGFRFFEALITAKKFSVSLLSINIPNTLYVLESQSHWLYTSENDGKIRDEKEFSKHQVYTCFENFRDESFDICAILRHPTSVCDMEANPLGWVEFSDKLLKGNLTSGTMIQRYIRPNGERPSVIRLFYISETKDNKASFAYCIVSSMRAIEQYSQAKNIVCSNIIGGFDMYQMHGLAISELLSSAKKIVKFLQFAYSVRIEEIVFDFIRDKDGKFWFLGCKGFNLDLIVLKSRELRIESQKDKSQEEIEDLKEQRLSAMHCKLCLLPFKPHELTHVLPFKMLLLYKRHTKKSGRKTMKLSHIRLLAIDFLSHSVRLCNLCYMLIVQENELIEVETKLANLLNVGIKPEDLTSQPTYNHPAFLPTLAIQWRIMFYFTGIDIPISCISHQLFLHFKIFEKIYSMCLCKATNHTSHIKLSKARLFYFFSIDSKHAEKLCAIEEMELFISKGEDGSKIIASGTSKPLRFFGCEMQEGDSITQPLEVILFSPDKKYFTLKLVAGIASDHKLNPRTLQINIRKYHSTYIPDECYFSSDILPNSWMEIFDPEYKENDGSQILSSSEELDQVYSPALEKDLILNTPFGSGKILHVNVDLNSSPRSKKETPRSTQETPKLSPIKNKREMLTLNIKKLNSDGKLLKPLKSTQSSRSAAKLFKSSSLSNTPSARLNSLSTRARSDAYSTNEENTKEDAAKEETDKEDTKSEFGELKSIVQNFLFQRNFKEQRISLPVNIVNSESAKEIKDKKLPEIAKSESVKEIIKEEARTIDRKTGKKKKGKRPKTAGYLKIEKKIGLVDIYAPKEIENLRKIFE